MRLVLYTGKGGVGKTTTAAATACLAAQDGLRTLVASADAAHSLGDVLGRPLGAAPTEVAPRLHALEIDARVEASRHWGHIRDYLVETFVYQGIEGVVAEELALLPGAEEITTLLAVEACAASGAWDLVVVDCAPTDSALRLVTLPDVVHRALGIVLPLARAVSGVAVPVARRLTELPLPDARVFRDVDTLVYERLRSLQERITDERTSVRIVVTPERMVIDEARRTYTELSLFEVPCDAVVMNRLLPEEAGDEAFFRHWRALQGERRREVEQLFAPLPVLAAPLREDEVTGVGALAEHGRGLFAGVRPEAVLCRVPRVRFEREGAGYLARVPLPGGDPRDLDVVKIDGELTITAGGRRRSLVLPRRVAALVLASARMDGAALVVRFRPADVEAA